MRATNLRPRGGDRKPSQLALPPPLCLRAAGAQHHLPPPRTLPWCSRCAAPPALAGAQRLGLARCTYCASRHLSFFCAPLLPPLVATFLLRALSHLSFLSAPLPPALRYTCCTCTHLSFFSAHLSGKRTLDQTRGMIPRYAAGATSGGASWGWGSKMRSGLCGCVDWMVLCGQVSPLCVDMLR